MVLKKTSTSLKYIPHQIAHPHMLIWFSISTSLSRLNYHTVAFYPSYHLIFNLPKAILKPPFSHFPPLRTYCILFKISPSKICKISKHTKNYLYQYSFELSIWYKALHTNNGRPFNCPTLLMQFFSFDTKLFLFQHFSFFNSDFLEAKLDNSHSETRQICSRTLTTSTIRLK